MNRKEPNRLIKKDGKLYYKDAKGKLQGLKEPAPPSPPPPPKKNACRSIKNIGHY
jgi:hypothetical protein